MEQIWIFKDQMEARMNELKPYVEEYEEIEQILDVIGIKGDNARAEADYSSKPKNGVDPLYKSAVNYASFREKISQRKMAKFFNIGLTRTKKIIRQMINDGYINEFNRSINGYATNLPSQANKLTVTTSKKKAKA